MDRSTKSAVHDIALEAERSEMRDELHTLGNCLARVKLGTRLLARDDLAPERRAELAQQLHDAVLEAESAFRLLSAQLK